MSFNESNTTEACLRDRLCDGILHHTSCLMEGTDHA